MKRASLAVLIVFSLASPVLAQVRQVVPTDRENTSGGGTFLGPLANAQRTYQFLIDSGELTNLVGQPISAITFRLLPSATTAWPPADATAADYDIFLSRSVDPSARSLTFANNVAGPQTQVRNGPLTIPAGSFPVGGSPQPFGVDIPFDVPYLYTGDDLLIELRHTGFSGTSGTNDAVLASGGPGNGYGVRFSAAWQSNATATTGLQANFVVARLTAVPEPGTLGIAFGGIVMLALRRRVPRPAP